MLVLLPDCHCLKSHGGKGSEWLHKPIFFALASASYSQIRSDTCLPPINWKASAPQAQHVSAGDGGGAMPAHFDPCLYPAPASTRAPGLHLVSKIIDLNRQRSFDIQQAISYVSKSFNWETSDCLPLTSPLASARVKTQSPMRNEKWPKWKTAGYH
jgi:hypothetical protein